MVNLGNQDLILKDQSLKIDTLIIIYIYNNYFNNFWQVKKLQKIWTSNLKNYSFIIKIFKIKNLYKYF